jgi:competence protein ComEC
MVPPPTDPCAVPAAAGRIQPLVALLCAVAAGIFCDHTLRCSEPRWLTLAFGSGTGWFFLWCRGHERTAAVVLLLAAAATAGAWHHDRWHLFPAAELGRCAREDARPICVEAIAWTTPHRRPPPAHNPLQRVVTGDRTLLDVCVTRVRDGAAWRLASGSARLSVDGHLLGVKVGDRLRVAGHFSQPSSPLNPGEFDFAFDRRVRRQLCQLQAGFPDCVTVLAAGSWADPRRWLAEIRERCRTLLWSHLRDRQAPLAVAVLLGVREELPENENQAFFATGTIHLLSISGLHVGVLAYGFWWVTRLLAWRRRVAVLAAAGFVVGYTLLTEAEAPVVRATVLIVAYCLSRLAGRHVFGFNVLAAAALVILAWNPSELFRTGTQLSFLAVATIYHFAPLIRQPVSADPLDRLIARTRPWPVRVWRHFMGSVGQVCLLGALIWLVALPLAMHRFHLFSPIAVALNPLVSAPMALALFAGFGVLLFGWLIPPVGSACGWLCNLSLASLEGLVDLGQRVKFGYAWTPGPAGWWVVGCYALLAVAAARPRFLPPLRWRLAILTAWIAVGLCSSESVKGLVRSERNPELHCTFVAVGHGACAVLELPHGRTVLCDAGHLGPSTGAARAIAGFLWSRGITRIDALVLSHPDTDHFNAVPELLERFSVGGTFVSPVMFEDLPPSLEVLQESLRAAGVPIREVRAGDRLAMPGATSLQILHPPRHGIVGSDNANSLVLEVTQAGRRLVLPGDLESPGMDDLLAEDPLDCDVVLAPHHGSLGSHPQGFGRWSSPEWVIISGARSEPVEQAYASRGRAVLHTAKQGAVRVSFSPRGVTVRTWRGRPW